MRNDVSVNGPAGEERRTQDGGQFGVERADLEQAVARVPGVETVRIVTGRGGSIAEVHVLASTERSPKQIVRDVQTVAVARFGVEIDYRTVSVVQLHDDVEPMRRNGAAAGRARPVIVAVRSQSDGRVASAEVDLLFEGKTVAGRAEGPGTSGLRLVASAVVDGLARASGSAGSRVDFADLIVASATPVALVVLALPTPRGEHVVCGCALVRRDPSDAVARATLDALNRLIDEQSVRA